MSDADTGRKTSRAPLIDAARGVAILAMIIFHFSWDLHQYSLFSVDVGRHPAWRLFSQSIAASFLTLVGISLERATRDGIRWPSFLRRLALVGGAALAITAATSLDTFMADSARSQFIYFGILHAIATFSVLALIFLRWPIAGLLAASAFVFFLPQVWRSPALNGTWLEWTGLATEVRPSLDFEPLFPWFAFVLLGLAVGKMRLAPLESTAPLPRTRVLQWLGRWSLVIYLVHQPLLIGGLEALHATGLLQRQTIAGEFEASCVAQCKASAANTAMCAQVCACTVSAMHQETTIFRERRAVRADDMTVVNRITQKCMTAYSPRP